MCSALVPRLMQGLLDSIIGPPQDSDHCATSRLAGRLRCLSVWGQRVGVGALAAEVGGPVALLDILLNKLLFPEVRACACGVGVVTSNPYYSRSVFTIRPLTAVLTIKRCLRSLGCVDVCVHRVHHACGTYMLTHQPRSSRPLPSDTGCIPRHACGATDTAAHWLVCHDPAAFEPDVAQ